MIDAKEIKSQIAKREKVESQCVNCGNCGNWACNRGHFVIDNRSWCYVKRHFTNAKNFCRAFKKNS